MLNRNQVSSLPKIVAVLAWLALPFATSAQHQELSLKKGIYVQQNIPCNAAPNAAIMAWDGVGFSSAHTSKCTSHAVRNRSGRFDVTTTCTALGDGSPNPAGASDTDSFQLTPLSATRFSMSKQPQRKRIYRWCSAKHVD